MIDNFDRLVARCTARRRTRIIRLSFFIVGGILLLLALVAGYMTWLSPVSKNVVQKPVAALAQSIPESNTTHSVSTASKPLAPAAASGGSAAALQPAVQKTPLPAAQPLPAVKNLTTAASSIPESVPVSVMAESPPRSSRLFEVNADTKTSTLDPLRAFDNNPKYETALAVARDFYGKNNFSDAAVWAKKANQMNREGEEAWMLYAKSYYAQGRKKEAMGVLELYMNYKDSKAAAELLRTWKQTPSN